MAITRDGNEATDAQATKTCTDDLWLRQKGMCKKAADCQQLLDSLLAIVYAVRQRRICILSATDDKDTRKNHQSKGDAQAKPQTKEAMPASEKDDLASTVL